MLQLDWSIARFRPNSVSTGWIETQFDFTPQSPQPSQTSLLMTRACRDRERAALPPPALLRGAGLVVDQHRRPRPAQLLLHRVEFLAVVDRRAVRPDACLRG